MKNGQVIALRARMNGFPARITTQLVALLKLPAHDSAGFATLELYLLSFMRSMNIRQDEP